MLKAIKTAGKTVLSRILEAQVRALRRKHPLQVVVVAGSVGKTSTKLAVAKVLEAEFRVRYQDGNYNDRLTVPLIFFDEREPAIWNIWAWLQLLRRNQKQIRGDYPYDVVVAELGTDGPGQMAAFAYLKPDLGVLTSVAPEHMEFFGTLDAVAQEELELGRYAKRMLVNVDDVAPHYLQGQTYQGYGFSATAAYRIADFQADDLKQPSLTLQLENTKLLVKAPLLGEQGAKIVLGAAAAASIMGLDTTKLQTGIERIGQVPGRMQILAGQQGATIIDDTYNASPLAVKAALDVMYQAKATQKIAILGSMNELGQTSPEAHREVGAYCRPDQLAMVVTIGKEAAEYLAPAAHQAGCTVKTFESPYEAGTFVQSLLKADTLVLAKGSQNRVFAEEALKVLLAQPHDSQRLVRQSAYWMAIKRQQFGRP